MTVAFVFSGGASLGSVQAGMLQSLDAEGIEPDIVLGTSVGAMNAAFIAGGGTADELVDIWLGLKGYKMFPTNPVLGLRAFLGRRPNFVPNDGIRKVLRDTLTFDQIEDSQLPLTVMATDAQTGTEVRLSEGPAVKSILASTAIPGVFPPISLHGRTLIDGGISNNTPISVAIEAGATEVWVLSTGYSCALAKAPDSAFELALHSVGMLVQQRLQLETRNADYPVPVRLIPPPCPITVPPNDFSQTAKLIDRAREGTAQWIANEMPHALPLIPHPHALGASF